MGVYLIGVYLMNVHLMGVYLIGVHLKGVYLINVHLTGVHLMGVHLTGVHLVKTSRSPWLICRDLSCKIRVFARGVVPIALRKRASSLLSELRHLGSSSDLAFTTTPPCQSTIIRDRSTILPLPIMLI
jgi:hypothetical protein